MLTESEVNGANGPSDVCQPSSPPKEDNMENAGTDSADPADIISTMRQEWEAEVVRLKKEAQIKLKEVNKEKESMVMRYANSEKEILKLRREMENFSKQVQSQMKEMETLNKKNKMLASERERLIYMVDAKVCDIQSLQKECDRLREENGSKDFKIKWTQNKLSGESDAHKETLAKLEKCTAELIEAQAEAHRMRQDCQDMINSYTLDPEISAINEQELCTQNGLINHTDDPSQDISESPQLNPFQKEIEILKQKHKSLIEENNSLSCRVQSLQQERLDMEHKMSRLQESNADHLHQIASLQSDLASADSLRIQFLSEQERVIALQGECEQLRQCNSDLLADMNLCRGKESELLAYTQQVTEKNVLLQSEFSSVEAKSIVLEEENKRLVSKFEELQRQVKLGEKSVSQEKKCSSHERQILLQELEEQKQKILQLEKQLDEAHGEILLMKKRHETSLRELTKELKIAMRCGKEGCNGSGDGMSQSSRTSSSTSLNTLDPSSKNNENHKEPEPPLIPDQQALIERIVKLQRMLAKKQEKNEFLEEYAKDLRETAQRQRKIIQSYAMCQDAGAMSSDISDKNKQAIESVITAEFVKHGGIMASLYASKSVDDGLTLDLSLEINRKLQALLEDTLLKNITLKENLSTLGEENSKLTDTIRRLKETIHTQPA